MKIIPGTLALLASNAIANDFTHIARPGVTTRSQALATRVNEMREALETQSDKVEGNLYYLDKIEDLLNEGAQPPNIDAFETTVEAKITKIQATPEYIASASSSNTASGNTSNTGAGDKVDETLINISNSNIIAIGSTRGLDCVGCTVPLDLRDLNEYGCWCNMGPGLGNGQSAPLDKFDEACKALQFCMRCTMMDNDELAEPEDTCDPRLNLYSVPFFFFGGLEQSCGMVNPGSTCNTRFCMCQTQWVWTVLDLSFEGEGVTEDLMHDNDDFNYDASCPLSHNPDGSGNRLIACCGDYPVRTPYNSFTLECCNEEAVYNPTVSACCTNGIQTIGTC